jgi:hypothetical protein
MQSKTTKATRSGATKNRLVNMTQSGALAAARDLLAGTESANERNFIDQYFKNVAQGKDPTFFFHAPRSNIIPSRTNERCQLY